MIDGVLDRDVLSFEIEKSCIDEKKVIGSFQKNSATIELLNPDNKYSNLKGTYINTYKGTFYVDDIEPVQEKIKIKLSCYDLAQKFENPYDSSKFTFPLTLKAWRNAICTEAGVEYDNTDFPNSDYELSEEPYIKKNATYKDVIKLIAQASSCWAIIGYDDKLYFNWFNNTLIEVQDWFDLTTEDESTDPVNIVVLGRGDVEDNVIYPETEPSNPKEIRIDSNDILDLNRKEMIVPIYNQVKDFKYTVFSMKTIGFLNAKIGNKIKYPDLYNNKKESYIMRHTLTFLGGDYSDSRNYTSQFEAVELDETNTNYKYAESIEERIDKTEITTNKLDGEIKAVTQKTTQISDELNNNYYSKTNINELLQTAESGITNTFSEAGGNNIFRNTGLWFTEQKTYQEEQTTNLLENSIYVYCTQLYDGPVYSGQTFSNTFEQSVELQSDFMIAYPFKIDSNASHKYYYTNTTSRYNIYLYELDKDVKFIENPYDNSTAKSLELAYSNGKDLTLNPQTEYLVIVGSKNDDGTSLTLDELNEYLSSISIMETKSIEVSEEAYEFWNGKVLRKSNDKASNNNSMLLQKGTLWQEQEVPNGNYSISFWYKKLISQSVASVVINDKEYQLNSTDYKQFYTGEKDSETNEYIVEPIVVTSGHLKIEFKCDTNGGLEVYDLMANKGSVKLAYSQNENETTTETVNISKGITITSTNMETIFKANANGIRILTLQNTTIAYFTDKGLSTKELTVENKAQVCGTLISEVGDQTWFTRM